MQQGRDEMTPHHDQTDTAFILKGILMWLLTAAGQWTAQDVVTWLGIVYTTLLIVSLVRRDYFGKKDTK